MKLKSDLFPYPVLYHGMDDIIDSKFSAHTEKNSISKSKVELRVDFFLENKAIQALIEEGKAVYAVHLEGVSSNYRKLVKLNKNSRTESIPISAKEVNGKIEVNMMIIADEDIPNYKNDNFNREYYDSNFTVNISKGDILAFDTMAEITLGFSNKENPNAKSMIRIAARNQQYMNVDVDGDVIQIFLPKKEYEAYNKISSMNIVKQNLLLTTIVLPALSFTIERIKNYEVDETAEWYTALLTMLEKIELDNESLQNQDSMIVAQRLLDLPFEGTLTEFYKEVSE